MKRPKKRTDHFIVEMIALLGSILYQKLHQEAAAHGLTGWMRFECFCIDGKQQYGELGYYTHNHKYGREAFNMKKSYNWLSDKDKRTVNFVKRKIHGLIIHVKKRMLKNGSLSKTL